MEEALSSSEPATCDFRQTAVPGSSLWVDGVGGWFQELTRTQLFGDQDKEPPRPSHTKCDQICWWDLEEGMSQRRGPELGTEGATQDWVGRRKNEEQPVEFRRTKGTLSGLVGQIEVCMRKRRW